MKVVKLKELAEQCYEKHELLGTYEFNKEKFAELIVRECVRRIEGCSIDPTQFKGEERMSKKEEALRLADEAGMQLAWIATVPGSNKMKVLCDFDQVQRLAEIVAAAEREACAKLCDEREKPNLYGVRECAQAIRARGEK